MSYQSKLVTVTNNKANPWVAVRTLQTVLASAESIPAVLDKPDLPCGAFAGEFELDGKSKTQSKLVQHSGLVFVDIDRQDVPIENVKALPHVIAAWPSYSGGIHALVATDYRPTEANGHKQLCEQVYDWVEKELQITVDRSVGKLAQLTFMPHIAAEHRAINDLATEFEFDPELYADTVAFNDSEEHEYGDNVCANATVENFAEAAGHGGEGWVEGKNYLCPLKGHSHGGSQVSDAQRELWFGRYDNSGDLFAYCAGKHGGPFNYRSWCYELGIEVPQPDYLYGLFDTEENDEGEQEVRINETVHEKRISELLEKLAGEPTLKRLQQHAAVHHISRSGFMVTLLAYLSAYVHPSISLRCGQLHTTPTNLFAMVTGNSGEGKSSTMAVVDNLLKNSLPISRVVRCTPNSAEGLLDSFLELVQDGKKKTLTQTHHQMVVYFDEMQQLCTVAGRQGNPILPLLRTAWSGYPLGAALSKLSNSQTRPNIEDYRIGAVGGCTYDTAKTLLEDTAQGTAQRWLCGLSTDKTFDSVDVDGVLPDLTLGIEHYSIEGSAIEVDDQIVKIVTDNRTAQLMQNPSAITGHTLLLRLRVAALVGWLTGEVGRVSLKSWKYAGYILEMSEAAKAHSIAAGKSLEASAAKAQGRVQGMRDVGRGDATVEELGNFLERIYRRVEDYRIEGMQLGAALSKACGGNYIYKYKQLSNHTGDASRKKLRAAVVNKYYGEI